VKKNKVIQIRISEKDKEMIDYISDFENNFNLSYFLRNCLVEKYHFIKEQHGVGFLKVK